MQNTLAEYGAANAPEPPASAPTPTSRPASTPSINQPAQTLPPPAAPAPVSAIPLHLQAQYRTTTPPSFSGTSSLPPSSALASSSSQGAAHTPTPPYGYNAANGQGNGPAGYSGYGQQGYGYQQQQQPPYQQQGAYQQSQYQQHTGYPGYPGYQQAPQAAASPAVAPIPTLPETLAGISDEQKVFPSLKITTEWFLILFQTLIMRVLAMTPEQINMMPPTDRATYIQIVRSPVFCFTFNTLTVPTYRERHWAYPHNNLCKFW